MPKTSALGRIPRHILLALACGILPHFAAAQTPATTGQASPSAPTFEVATIKPAKADANGADWDRDENHLVIKNFTLRDLIKRCYHLHANSQIIGGPDWIGRKHFDIEAKIDEEEMARINKMTRADKMREFDLLMESLLADRFRLKQHEETRSLPAYALQINGVASKLTPVDPTKPSGDHSLSSRDGHLEAKSISMDRFAQGLSSMRELEDRVVINRTSLGGDFDFTLDWTPDGAPTASDAKNPGLFTAIREQLGLKLEHETASVPVAIIEAATLPDFD